MHLTPDSSPDTRSRLLEAAGEVFAEVGYKNATIREICQKAGANVAAVNYHFRDKEGLYRALFDYAAHCALAKYPIGGGVDAAAPPEDRLRAFVKTYMSRLLDEGRPAWHGKLMAREMVEPTGALDILAESFARPQYQRLSGILRELLGPVMSDETIRLCAASIVGQCLFYKQCRPMIERLMPEQKYDEASLGALAAHISAFSLGAVRQLKQSSNGGTP
jgi:AcrR family transcriptional regulator